MVVQDTRGMSRTTRFAAGECLQWAMHLTPLGGVVMPAGYPRTLAEFNAWFADEAACLAYLARLRWPDGFVCPHCGATRAWQLARRRKLRCAGCRREISITAATVFADSHLPLMS